jgi:L-proline amide hydrolase
MSDQMKWEHGNTWYRVVGDLKSGKTPVMVLHGGPGAAHNYCIPIAELIAQTGRACVLYDQIGCGNSTHLPDADKDFLELLTNIQLLANHGVECWECNLQLLNPLGLLH